MIVSKTHSSNCICYLYSCH